MFSTLFGKYKVLVSAIALFLIFDLGVLILNFYTSGQIAAQTERINLAARQRTLTQQMSKATLYIKSQKLLQWPYESGLTELENHFTVFDQTLQALNSGGTVISTQTGSSILIPAVEDASGQQILSEANSLWQQFETALSPVMVDLLVTDEEIVPASDFIARNNLVMFEIMNRLTNHFKAEADDQTRFLRIAQVVGITLATLNFFIILFHFLRQLRERDEKLEIAKEESDQILVTIDEGVMLVNEDLQIGGQHSRYIEELFRTKRVSGAKFDKFLTDYLPADTVSIAVNYIKLFFAQHVSPELVSEINPLHRVTANIEVAEGEWEARFLNFTFAKLRQVEGKNAVLVTIKDVTAEVTLEEQDLRNEDRHQQQLEVLTEILPIEPKDLELFIEHYEAGLDNLNHLLKKNSLRPERYREIIQSLFREAHKLKGEASALALPTITKHIQEFEDQLSILRDKSALRGRDFLPLTIQLKEQIESLESIQEMRGRLAKHGVSNRGNSISAKSEHLPQAIQDGAFSRWKNVLNLVNTKDQAVHHASRKNPAEIIFRDFDVELDESTKSKLYGAAIQLVQNSLKHGIENPAQRKAARKPETGLICLSLSGNDASGYRFAVEDDGKGFDYEAIRNKLVDSVLVSAQEAKQMSNAELVRWTLKDGVSTAVEVDELAGRGVGLAAVRQTVQELGGKLKVRSASGQTTQFIIYFESRPSRELRA